MTKFFDLTSDQQTKIKPILVDEQKKMEDLRSDSSGDRQAMREKMFQIQKDTNAQIRDVLDDKQKEKFDNQQQDRGRERTKSSGRRARWSRRLLLGQRERAVTIRAELHRRTDEFAFALEFLVSTSAECHSE